MRKERNAWSPREVIVEKILSFQRTEQLVNPAKPWQGKWVLINAGTARHANIPSTKVPPGELDPNKYYLVTYFKRKKGGASFGKCFLALKQSAI